MADIEQGSFFIIEIFADIYTRLKAVYFTLKDTRITFSGEHDNDKMSEQKVYSKPTLV